MTEEARQYDGTPAGARVLVHWAPWGLIRDHGGVLQVETADGEVVEARKGDWIIKSDDGTLRVQKGETR